MDYMGKFYELFRRDLKTERLELRLLRPTQENADMVYNVLKHENPEDYKYTDYTATHKSRIAQSAAEVLEIMRTDSGYDNGCTYYVFHNNKLVGYMRIHFWETSRTLQCASVWLIKSARGHGFNKEIHDKLEDLAFNHLHVNRICRQTMAGNLSSKKSIETSGYHLDGIDRQSNRMPDGTYTDHLWYSKLVSEYKQK